MIESEQLTQGTTKHSIIIASDIYKGRAKTDLEAFYDRLETDVN